MSGADRFAEDWGNNGTRFGSGPGYESSYGSGYGSGGADDGEGYGCGCGSGRCSIDGSGYGSSYGSGSCYGSGDGRGAGSGGGNGRGGDCNGSGVGYGEGVSEYNGRKVYVIDGIETMIDHVHGDAAKGRILRDDLTTVPCYIVKRDGLFAHGKTLREAMDALREKLFENMPEDERIAEFIKAHKWGEKYSAVDFYDWHHRLTGSCEMGRREFAKLHGYSLTEEELLTVEEFIELTKNSYGGSVIRKLREAYGRDER